MNKRVIFIFITVFIFTLKTFSNPNSKYAVSMVLACHRGNLNKVKQLLENGASVDAQMPGMLTPAITSAAARGHYNIVKFLISKGANVNLKASTGETALMGACGYGLIRTVKLLLKNGAKVNQVCKRGMSAFLYAVNNGHYLITKMLIKNGANTKIKIRNRFDAVYFAKRKKHYALINLLKGKNKRKNIIKLKSLKSAKTFKKGRTYKIKIQFLGLLPNGKLFIPVFADRVNKKRLMLMGRISKDLLSSVHRLQKIKYYIVTFEHFALAGPQVVANFVDLDVD